MARSSGSELDLSGWTNCQDSESHQKRSDIIHEIIENGSLDQLRTIVESGWDVNEELKGYDPHMPLLHAITHSKNYVQLLKIVQLLLEHGAIPNVSHGVNVGGYEETKWVQRTALHEAARRGCTELVKMLLDADAKCITFDGLQNPLALALQNHDFPPDLIKLLLKHGAEPNDHDDQLENIPLLNAIKNGRYTPNYTIIVQLLLEHGANPNVAHREKKERKKKNKKKVAHRVNIARQEEAEWVQRTALHEAIFRGWTEGVKMLLDAGAKCTTSDGLQNPLSLALQTHKCPHKCPPDLIELLLKHGADPNDHDDQLENIPLIGAIKNVSYPEYKTTIVQLLLVAGAKCKTIGAFQSPLALALQASQCPPDLIELLLQHGADPNEHDDQFENIPLLMAIKFGRYTHQSDTNVKLLLEHGANPNIACRLDRERRYRQTKWEQGTTRHEALEQEWTEVVKMLLDAGAKCMTFRSVNPLMLALENDDCPPELIEMLLKHGADPNYHKTDRDIPLFDTITNCRNELHFSKTVQLLLEHGANQNVAGRVNTGRYEEAKWVHQTALHQAARQGWTEGVKMLLDAGAKCTMSDGLQNPLALALQNDDCPTDLIELLLKHGADPNDHDDRRENIPLLIAISNHRYDKDATIIVQLLLEHGANPNVSYRVNTGGYGEATWVHRTALHKAARRGCTELVKMLLDAGAKCTMSLQNQMGLAIQNDDCHPDLIELLLKHGADTNYHKADQGVPLLCAITTIRNNLHLSKIVQLLLEHGANPNVSYKVNIGGYGEAKWVHSTALHEAARQGCPAEVVKMLLDAGAIYVTSDILENPLALALRNYDSPPDLIELLLRLGADLHYVETADEVDEPRPLLHKLTQYNFHGHHTFLQQQLDLVFLHGGNINMEDGDHGTALEHAVTEGGHSNSVRWLIKHGADTLIKFTLLKGHFMQSIVSRFPETPLILLQAGMRVPHGAQAQLSNMEVAISTWLQDDTANNGDIRRTIRGMWEQLEQAEEEELQTVQCNLKKSTFPEYWTRQMVDLQEFSDESLQGYPEDTYISHTGGTRQENQNMLDQIHRVLQFLSQPQSLQWHCRCCIREKLVSLQPSVVKTLLVPARLKCYILCHEI